MELQELKNRWTSVDEKLKKQEVLNTRMLEEVLKKKSGGALSRLINKGIVESVVLFLIIFLGIWSLNSNTISILPLTTIAVIAGIVACLTDIVLNCYALMKYLTKIDVSKNIKDNSLYVNKLNTFYRRWKKVDYFIFIPVASILVALFLYEFSTVLNAGIRLWMFSTMILLMVIGYIIWIYKASEKNIQTIKESLAELNELEE